MLKRVVALIALSGAGLSLAQAPLLLGYQGRLLKTDGTPEGGTVQMRFGFFPGDTGGTSLWEENQAVALTQGFYSTYLGRGTAFPATVFDTGTVWLEVAVQAAGDTQFRTMTPRQRVGSVAYAISARNVKGGTVDATSVSVNGTPVIDANGKLTASAGYTAGPGISIDGTTRAISVNSSGCTTGQVLQWNGSNWQCAMVSGGSAGITGVTGTAPIVVTGTTAPVVSVTVGTAANTVAAGNDSRFGNATSLQGAPVGAASPGNGQVLGFNAGSWGPVTPSVAGTAPIVVTGTTSPVVSVTVGTTANTVAAGDDSRFGTALTLRGVPISTVAPDAGQSLVFNGTQWVPGRFTFAASCKELLQAGRTTSGVYTIQTSSTDAPVQVYCDQTTDQGGWTLLITLAPSTTTNTINFAYSTNWPSTFDTQGTAPTRTGMYHGSLAPFSEVREEVGSGCLTVWARNLNPRALEQIRQLYGWQSRMQVAPTWGGVPSCRLSYAGTTDNIVACANPAFPLSSANTPSVLGFTVDPLSIGNHWFARGNCCSTSGGSSTCGGDVNGTRWARTWFR